MTKIMTEEHGKYGIDCTNAIWSSEDIHSLYHAGGISFLCDADFVLETEQHILLIEYKNAKIKEALQVGKEGATERDIMNWLKISEYENVTEAQINPMIKELNKQIEAKRGGQ